ncbi:hypothetical protein HDU98_005487 [Podochytrium sp. JEL0797]|nr:hypothetical protein HDU98_005487 [Podochytrium sp. JEL0797]
MPLLSTTDMHCPARTPATESAEPSSDHPMSPICRLVASLTINKRRLSLKLTEAVAKVTGKKPASFGTGDTGVYQRLDEVRPCRPCTPTPSNQARSTADHLKESFVSPDDETDNESEASLHSLEDELASADVFDHVAFRYIPPVDQILSFAPLCEGPGKALDWNALEIPLCMEIDKEVGDVKSLIPRWGAALTPREVACHTINYIYYPATN